MDSFILRAKGTFNSGLNEGRFFFLYRYILSKLGTSFGYKRQVHCFSNDFSFLQSVLAYSES